MPFDRPDPVRIGLVVAVGAIVMAACGGDAAESPTIAGTGDDSAATTTLAATTAPPTTASSTTGTSSSTTSPPRATSPTSTTIASSTTTTIAPTTTLEEEPAIERATGSGVVELDDRSFEVEVVLCGWLDGGSGSPLAGEPNSRNDFRLRTVAVLEDGLFVLDVDRDAAVGPIWVSVELLRAPEEGDSESISWANERQFYTAITIEGKRITTDRPLVVLEDSTDMFSPAHEVTFDVRCDSFGGIPDEYVEQLSAVLGVEPPELTGEGVVVIDGESYDVTTRECGVVAGALEITAESEDGAVVVTATDLGSETAGIISDTIWAEVDGEILVVAEDLDLVAEDDRIRTTGPVPYTGPDLGEQLGTMSVDLLCG